MPLKHPVAALLIGAALAQPALADEVPGTFSVRLENDFIGDTDGHYTHGTRFEWVAGDATAGPEALRDALDFLFPFGDLSGGRIGFALGQNIYTAEDTSTADLVENDRPYAGWLYVGASLSDETPLGPGRRFSNLTTVELDLGIVGPDAYGKQVQNGYHSLAGFDKAHGWSHQLKNEPAASLIMSRTWRSAPLDLGPLSADFLPAVDGSVGNVTVHGGGGALFRIGQGLDIDYGPARNPPFYSPATIANPGRDFAWYVFAGADGRVVAHNIFLDGNTFADSHSVDRKWLVGDLRFGAAILVSGVKIEFSETIRSKEFTEQDDPDRFATLTLSARF
mgnify:CR=1 FL=1